MRIGIAIGLMLATATLAAAHSGAQAQDRDAKVRADKEKVTGGGFWIYDDLPRGIETAKKSGKPLLVVFRCIPCEACAQIDEQVAERDPAVAAYLDKFVCVRIPHTNGMDLSLFQFDYDQSWAAFFLNADMTIYGRYGTRSHRTESQNDVSVEGFAKALEGALELHAKYPANKDVLAAKRGAPVSVKAPEDLPAFKGKFRAAIDYDGQVAKSCIHCHQVGESMRLAFHDEGKPIPQELLFPYPNPKVIGLVMDPKGRARVLSVTEGSVAEKAGFHAGDEITTFAGQPILSIADLQWVLQHAGERFGIKGEVARDGKTVAVELFLPAGWRTHDDIAWRATSWDLRRMVSGGLVLEDMSDEARGKAGIDDKSLALQVVGVGQYGEHATAKKIGFREDDIVIALDGTTSRMTESEWLTSLASRKKRGDSLRVKLRRGGEELELTLPVQ